MHFVIRIFISGQISETAHENSFFTLSFWRWIREPGLLILLNTQCIRIQVYKTLIVSLTPRLSSLDNLRLLTGAAVPTSPNLPASAGTTPVGSSESSRLPTPLVNSSETKVLWIWSQNLTWLQFLLTDPRSVLWDLISDLLLPLHPSLSNTWNQIYQILPPSAFLLLSMSNSPSSHKHYSVACSWDPTTTLVTHSHASVC